MAFNVLGVFKLKNYQMLKKEVVLVYTPGKVGSSTVLETLMYNFPYNKIYQAHYLNDEYIRVMSKYGMARQKKINTILKNGNFDRLKIITLLRDPIAQSMSELFQNINKYHPVHEVLKMDYKSLLHEYNNMPKTYRWFDTEEWFDMEFKEKTRIDVYKYPFDKKQGYQIINEDNIDILIIPLENLNKVFKESIDRFFKFNLGRIIKVNEAKDKTLGGKYNEFKIQYKLDDSSLDKKYSSKYVTHFYSDEQINKFKDKWRIKE